MTDSIETKIDPITGETVNEITPEKKTRKRTVAVIALAVTLALLAGAAILFPDARDEIGSVIKSILQFAVTLLAGV